MNIRLGKQETIAVAVVIIILHGLVFWMFGYRPAINEINSLRAQQEELKKTIENNKLTLQRLQELRAEASKVEAETIRILASLPVKPEIPSLLIQIEDIADRSGVSIDTFKPSPPVKNGNHTEIPIDLIVNSRFNEFPENGGSLIEFLYRLEHMERLVDISSINVVKQGDSSNLTVTLKLNAYSLEGEQVAAQGQ